MATPVLPYPDMDFTPLDILTAAEMDQMVANDQYLRDFCAGLADGTNLSDGVIQARKLAPGLSSYSTTEQDTGKTWIDGRHIYKKTIDWGFMPNNDRTIKNNQYPLGGQVIEIDAIAILTDGPTPGPMHQIPYVSADGAYDTIWATSPESGIITIATTADRSNWRAYVTTYYVKPS